MTGSLTPLLSSEASANPTSAPAVGAGWLFSCGWQLPPAGAPCNSVLAFAFPPPAQPNSYQRWAQESLAQTWAAGSVCSLSESGTHMMQVTILSGNKLYAQAAAQENANTLEEGRNGELRNHQMGNTYGYS